MFNIETEHNVLRPDALKHVFSIKWMSGFITCADDSPEQKDTKFLDDATMLPSLFHDNRDFGLMNFHFSS